MLEKISDQGFDELIFPRWHETDVTCNTRYMSRGRKAAGAVQRSPASKGIVAPDPVALLVVPATCAAPYRMRARVVTVSKHTERRDRSAFYPRQSEPNNLSAVVSLEFPIPKTGDLLCDLRPSGSGAAADVVGDEREHFAKIVLRDNQVSSSKRNRIPFPSFIR